MPNSANYKVDTKKIISSSKEPSVALSNFLKGIYNMAGNPVEVKLIKEPKLFMRQEFTVEVYSEGTTDIFRNNIDNLVYEEVTSHFFNLICSLNVENSNLTAIYINSSEDDNEDFKTIFKLNKNNPYPIKTVTYNSQKLLNLPEDYRSQYVFDATHNMKEITNTIKNIDIPVEYYLIDKSKEDGNTVKEFEKKIM